jgi:hypothetical protein
MVLLAAGVLTLAASTVGAALAAGAPPALGSFSEYATAPGIQIMIDGGGSTQGPQALTFPQAQSDLAAGYGHGLAAIVWPGNAGGNLGSVINVLGLSQIPPALLQPIRDNASLLNDPVRAEVYAPSRASDAVYPQGATADNAVMRTHADLARVESWANTPAMPSLAGAGAVGPIAAHSTTVTKSGTVVSDGKSVINDVAFGSSGGTALVSIDSVTSIAHATSDGRKATTSGTTTVSGMMVGGVPVTIDDKGIHVAGNGATPLQTLSDSLNQAIAQSGLKVLLTQPQLNATGAKATYTGGAVVMQWSQHGYVFTVTIGGASVGVSATPAVPSVDLTTPAATTGGGAGSGGAPATSALATGTGGGAESLGGPGSSTIGVSPPASGNATPFPAASADSAGSAAAGNGVLAAATDSFGGVPLGIILVGLFGVGLVGEGLRRLRTWVFAQAVAIPCPLDAATNRR